jgi:hypothetical protein
MDRYEARYRVVEALIQQGPCTSAEVKNTIRGGDGTLLDALPILMDLEDRCVEYDNELEKWRVIGSGTGASSGESMGDEYATPVSGDQLAQMNEERAR